VQGVIADHLVTCGREFPAARQNIIAMKKANAST